METRRVVVMVTCAAVAVLAVVLTIMQWEEASKVATAVSALAAVAGVGAAVWAALSGTSGAKIRVADTGKATSGPGGKAKTGLSAPADQIRGTIEVERSVDADASPAVRLPLEST